ncbi:hypothetical protein K2173_017431 [Erythroxylum novogranatense]|uniref:Uncharacterized protein n=1 Tax=Erythroxylum novogranatense TaxID=1862640 RepID=A0AAV8TKP7_9ROSI|nr:hypothetical protein K2173_017431 [Erythroxylum novogranatense]
MSIALDTSRGSIIQLPTFCVASAASMFESSPEADEVIGVEGECSTSSTATSSIGQNSDLTDRGSSDGDECEDNEVQSAFAGTLNSMNSLEEALSVRRGISKFINGKSKSFTSLTDATSFPSIKAIVKPENAYAKRRRNLLAYNYLWEKNRSLIYRSGISKKPIASSRSSSTLARAVAISSSDSNSRSPPRLLPGILQETSNATLL